MARRKNNPVSATPTRPTAQEMSMRYAQSLEKTVNFAKAEGALKILDNIQKTRTNTISAFDKKKLRTYLQNIGSNENNLRQLSRYLYYRSQPYKRLIWYNANMFDLDCRSIIPGDFDMVKNPNPKKLLKSINETANILDRMNLNYEFRKVATTCMIEDVFYGCASLKTVQLPDGLEQIGKSCFERCTALTGMNIIPNSVTSLGSGAFSGCTALANVTLPSGLTSIPNTLLSQTAIESIVIPSGVTSIGTSAFYSCPKLKTIDIPSGVTSIGNSAFGECPLESITVRAIVPPTLGGSNVFNRVPSTCPIYVPSESVSAYKAATYWKTRASYIQAIAE